MDDISVLGVSPGMITAGIAVLYNGKLYDWGMKYLNTPWPEEKIKQTLTFISEYVRQYNVTHIALKVTHEKRRSSDLTTLIQAILDFGKNAGIPVETFSIVGIKNLYEKKNQSEFMKEVVNQFPELLPEHRKEESNKKKYYFRMFEAVACAYLKSKSIF